MKIHAEALPKDTERLLPSLAEMPSVKNFYLAGGTALALQIGHRISGDLDFFSEEAFDESLLIQKLSGSYEFQIEKKSEQTVLSIISGVKVSFLGYPYPLLVPANEALGVRVADIRDIACMKIDAASNRGTKRDFIDLYCIIRAAFSLSDILQFFEKKYSILHYNMMHIKKSLVYFEDAEGDPMPQMLQPVSWEEVKSFLEREALRLS
ncbi:MAG: nucleotidyl transferase AbiEii/AbiGii toxin family protein [Patescibacteria group bacterium]